MTQCAMSGVLRGIAIQITGLKTEKTEEIIKNGRRNQEFFW
jgi:hypothetical protein